MNLIWCKYIVLYLTFILNINSAQSDKILFVAFMSGKSHKIVYEPLLLELAKKGHQVTTFTPVPSNKIIKNVREILTINYKESFKEMPNMFEMKERNEMMNPFIMVELFSKLCRDTYDLPQVKNLLNETFDLIISQPLFNECAMGYIHHFKSPTILISLFSAPPMLTWVTGTPSPSSFVPSLFLSYTDKMTYYERMVNFATTVGMDAIQNFYFKPKMTQIYREKLGDPTIPPVDYILANASFILSNAHFSLSPPKPFLPDVVDVGGMHCRPAQPLSKDLEKFVNSSGIDGFIYFSMGSAIQTDTMPEKLRKVLVNVFSKLKQKVLWKWETEEMPDLPKNVKLGKWLPQQDILGHPKIKMFITHGGYGSTTEAAYHGTPLLGIPMFGDQMLNMEKSKNLGFALNIQFNEITEKTLLVSINRILNEPSFMDRAKHLSRIFHDQPDKPLDRAVFWTEYVMRHKGAVHMRSAARDLNLLQYHSIDVIASYATILFVIIYTIHSLCQFLLKKLCESSKKSITSKNGHSHSNKKIK